MEELIEKYPLTFDCRILDVTDVPAIQNTVKGTLAATVQRLEERVADYKTQTELAASTDI